jgi:nicotinate-nucleotide adenylyltransferase
LAVARAAMRRFHFDCVYFIPSARPPHKSALELLPFAHRLAMVALACAGESRFVPSLAESDCSNGAGKVFYSVDTVRLFRRLFKRPGDRIYFLLGADSFLHIREWKDYQTLLGLCDFVVAHRPGFPSESLRRAIPERLLAVPKVAAGAAAGRIALRKTTIHLLNTVDSEVSATAVRQRLDRGGTIRGLVPAAVEEYIKKQALY